MKTDAFEVINRHLHKIWDTLTTNSLDINSIPLENIKSVVTKQEVTLAKINIEVKNHSIIIDCSNKQTVKIIGFLVNEWLKILNNRKSEINEKKTKSSVGVVHNKNNLNLQIRKPISINYENYKTFTEQKDWASICNLNGLELSSTKFGTMKEMNLLSAQLQLDEVVFGFTAGVMVNKGDSNLSDFGASTWVIVLTDRRFLFLDAALLSSSLDVHSILHKNVQGVMVAQGYVLGKISIETGSRSTIIDNCEKNTVKVLGDLANEWLQTLEERKLEAHAPIVTEESCLDKLKKLGELRDLGVLTEKEFENAKAKILTLL